MVQVPLPQVDLWGPMLDIGVELGHLQGEIVEGKVLAAALLAYAAIAVNGQNTVGVASVASSNLKSGIEG
jgi:hypothetical protein